MGPLRLSFAPLAQTSSYATGYRYKLSNGILSMKYLLTAEPHMVSTYVFLSLHAKQKVAKKIEQQIVISVCTMR